MSCDQVTSFPWEEVKDLEKFRSPEWTQRISEQLTPHDDTGQKLVAQQLEKSYATSLNRLQKLEKELKKQFILKDDIIKMVIVCSIAHQPMLLVGKPGTAKSKIVLRFCEGLGLTKGSKSERRNVFQYLLHAFTEPDELLGPVIIDSLKGAKPEFTRFRDGSITDAEVIFMDEVFRGNSAVLNTLLSVINERQVYEGGTLHRAKARLVFGASNSTPTARQLEDLRAFYERFIIRVESDYVPLEFAAHGGGLSSNREQLLKMGWENEVRELRAGYHPEGAAMEPVACLNDILLLNRCVAELWGGADLNQNADFITRYHHAVATLAGGQSPVCEIDDRKFIRLMAVIRAHSLYTHSGMPKQTDLTVLRYIWNDTEGKRAVEEAVNALL